MANKTPRGFCALDNLIWGHPGIRALSHHAALTYIFLIAWSKAFRRDGNIDAFAIPSVGANQEVVDELIKAGFLSTLESGGWNMPTWQNWQVTTNELGALGDVGKENGYKGGRPPTRKEQNTGGVELDAQREEWLAIAFGSWPAPGKDFRRESDANVRMAFYEAVKTKDDWDKFCIALDTKLERYKRNTEPRDIKRPFLSSFQKFCASWRETIQESTEPIKVPAKPVQSMEPAPFRVVIEDEGQWPTLR
jgi:hypothetical protein